MFLKREVYDNVKCIFGGEYEILVVYMKILLQELKM